MKKSEFKAWFNTFYNKTYSSAMRYCMAKTGDFVNSEDLLADAYYAFYKYASKPKNVIEDPANYFFKVLKNEVSKYWTKHRKEQAVTESLEDDGSYEALMETEFDLTAEIAMEQMLLQDILEYVSELPLPIRRAFALRFYLGKTIEETAEELKISVPAARNYIYRTLKDIREKFMDDYE